MDSIVAGKRSFRVSALYFLLAIRGQWPMEYQGVSIFPKYIFFLLHCVPLYFCRLCINFQGLCTRLLGMATLRILLLTFISRFVIDFLSIRKVIIFSAFATDDRHPKGHVLYTKMLQIA